jgi:DNA primase small subunit
MDKTTQYIQRKFSEYYEKTELQYPSHFEQREYGFMHFDNRPFDRHHYFKSRGELKNYLVKNTPANVYYSPAYYENPDAPIQEKVLLGSDLIFDIDADHFQGADKMTFEEMLACAKSEIMKLVYDFLLSDFGFEEKYVHILFSGGRGYHVHIDDPKVLNQTGQERREIIDYLGATNIDAGRIIQTMDSGIMPKNISALRYVDASKVGKYRTLKPLPPKDAPGWKGRITRNFINFIEKLEKIDEASAVKRLVAHGIDEKKALKIYKILFEGQKGKRPIDKVKEGYLDVFPEYAIVNTFLEIAMNEGKIKCEIDDLVTSRTKGSLIRFPTSLHGKTGFKVVPIPIDKLDDFEPLNDAIVFGDDKITIDVKKPLEINLKGETFKLDIGKNEVPEYVGIFAIGRKVAEICG